MKTSTEGLVALIGHEGIVQSRYKDSVGVWTIGVGHTKAAGGINPETFAGTLTMSQALDLLRTDIAKYEKDVSDAVHVSLKQHEFDALVSFHFNTGAIKKASFVKKMNAGDRAGALKGIMDWRKPAEIIPRRTAERDLFKTGVYPAPFANVYPADKNGKVLWGQGKHVDVKALLGQPAAAAPAPKPTPAPPVAESKPASPKPSLISAIIKIIATLFGRKPA
jgi:lysozyme